MSLGKIGRAVLSPFSAILGDKVTSALLSIAAAIPGPHQPFAAAAAFAFGVFTSITAPGPVARGSVTNVIIDSEPPRPYMIGESYSAGIMRHRVAYGPTRKKVPNPYLWEVKVFSGVGPVQQLVQEQFDFQAIGSYYNGFYARDFRLGTRMETSLVPQLFGRATGWGGASALSGCAAIGGNYLFDKDGVVFASGLPVHGAIWRGEKVYDPRLDSTYPGGVGSHRLGVESTYTYSDNPALHAATYAFGRYQSGIKIFGIGLSAAGIDWASVVDWANDCETNQWTCHGSIYEGGRGADVRQQRIRNLDDICASGGGRWITAGALLSFDWHRPRVPLATLTDADLTDEGGSAVAVQSVRDRMNGVRPQYISPANNWEQVTADEIIGSTYRTEDGRPLTQTWALNLVKSEEQAGELASYALVDSREIGPISLNAKADWRFYRPGETINVNSAVLGFNGQAVILQRDIDPVTFAVRLMLKSETPAKHDFALGKVAVPPPTPIITQSQEDRDNAAAGGNIPRPVDLTGIFEPANANRVPFSRFEGGRGWVASGDFNPTPFHIQFDGRFFIAAEPTFTAVDQNVFLFNAPRFQVLPGERLSVSGRVQAFTLPSGGSPNFWQFYIEYYTAAGAIVSATIINSATAGVNESALQSGFSTVPATAATAQIVLRFESNGAGLARLAIIDPMVTSAAVDQVVHPAYSPGPNARDGADPNSDITIGGDGLLNGIGTPGINVDNGKVPIGGNAVVNSEFTRGKFGWNWAGGAFEADWGVNLPNWFGHRNVMYAQVSGTFASGANRDLAPNAIWNGAPLANAPLLALPVVAGDTVLAAVQAAPHRCTFQLFLLMFDAAGTLISAPVIAGGTPLGAANGDLANFTRISISGVAPANARWAIPMMRLVGTGEVNPFIFFTEPMITKIAAGQTAVPGYIQGRADGNADVTATAQRSIEPQFPSIEIKRGEAGHTGNRTITHVALRATTALTGGTWSLPAQSLGAGSASINSSTGTVTLSGIVQSGSYTTRYTHTDGTPTDRAVPVIYVPTPPSGVVSAKTGRAPTTGGTAGGGGWETILTLPLTGAPAGRVNFGGVEGLSFLFPITGSGTADYEARLQVNGVTLTSVGTQNVVTGGVINFVSFSDLFVGSYAVSAGTLTFTIDLRLTSGSGTIDTTNTALEATVIAS